MTANLMYFPRNFLSTKGKGFCYHGLVSLDVPNLELLSLIPYRHQLYHLFWPGLVTGQVLVARGKWEQGRVLCDKTRNALILS